MNDQEHYRLMKAIADKAGLRHLTLSSDRITSEESLQKPVAGQGVNAVLVRTRYFPDVVVENPDGIPTLGQVLQAVDALHAEHGPDDHVFFEGYRPSGAHDPKKGKLLTINVMLGS